MPAYSLITLTEPLPESTWAEIGWRERECIESARYMIDYLSKTADGRILFGGRGAPYHFGSAIKDEYDQHEPTHQTLHPGAWPDAGTPKQAVQLGDRGGPQPQQAQR